MYGTCGRIDNKADFDFLTDLPGSWDTSSLKRSVRLKCRRETKSSQTSSSRTLGRMWMTRCWRRYSVDSVSVYLFCGCGWNERFLSCFIASVLCMRGPTLSVRVMTDEKGISRGFGFASFENHSDAKRVSDVKVKCVILKELTVEYYVHQRILGRIFQVLNIQKNLFLDVKGIVHFEIKMWYLSAYPKGIQDVGVFFSSVDPILMFLGQTVLVCQSYNGRYRSLSL